MFFIISKLAYLKWLYEKDEGNVNLQEILHLSFENVRAK